MVLPHSPIWDGFFVFKPWWTAKTHLNIGVDAKHKLCFSEEKLHSRILKDINQHVLLRQIIICKSRMGKNAPKVIPNTSFTKPIKEGLTPILSAFKEQPHNVWSNETIKKTLVIVNDTTEFLIKRFLFLYQWEKKCGIAVLKSNLDV